MKVILTESQLRWLIREEVSTNIAGVTQDEPEQLTDVQQDASSAQQGTTVQQQTQQTQTKTTGDAGVDTSDITINQNGEVDVQSAVRSIVLSVFMGILTGKDTIGNLIMEICGNDPNGEMKADQIASGVFANLGTGGENLSDEIYQECANRIGCDVPALKAVKAVESGSRGAFFGTGKPTILFEGHVFWRELKRRGVNPQQYANGNQDILYPSWTKKYYKGGMGEYERLERAKQISIQATGNDEAALASASWGLFQVMGFNYQACGCGSVTEFVSRMCSSAEEQMRLTTSFICNKTNIRKALIAHDWSTFAYYYNGSGYKKNSYDTKIAAAYKKLSGGV